MKTIYTLTVDIPNKAGLLSRRTFFFGSIKSRQPVLDAMRERGYRVATNIEHVFTTKEAIDAISAEERWEPFHARAA